MRVLHAVENDDEGRFAPTLGEREYLFRLAVFEVGHLGDEALVPSAVLGLAVERGLVAEKYLYPSVLGFLYDAVGARVAQVALYDQTVYGRAALERLFHRVTSVYLHSPFTSPFS